MRKRAKRVALPALPWHQQELAVVLPELDKVVRSLLEIKAVKTPGAAKNIKDALRLGGGHAPRSSVSTELSTKISAQFRGYYENLASRQIKAISTSNYSAIMDSEGKVKGATVSDAMKRIAASVAKTYQAMQRDGKPRTCSARTVREVMDEQLARKDAVEPVDFYGRLMVLLEARTLAKGMGLRPLGKVDSLGMAAHRLDVAKGLLTSEWLQKQMDERPDLPEGCPYGLYMQLLVDACKQREKILEKLIEAQISSQ